MTENHNHILNAASPGDHLNDALPSQELHETRLIAERDNQRHDNNTEAQDEAAAPEAEAQSAVQTTRRKAPYKSFRKKYRKMEIQFAKVMKRSEDLYRQNRVARRAFDRLLREKSRLLDIMIDIHDAKGGPELGYPDSVPLSDLESGNIDLSLWNDDVKHLAMLYDNSYEFSDDEKTAPVPRNPMCLLEWLRRNQPNVFAPENENFFGTDSTAPGVNVAAVAAAAAAAMSGSASLPPAGLAAGNGHSTGPLSAASNAASIAAGYGGADGAAGAVSGAGAGASDAMLNTDADAGLTATGKPRRKRKSNVSTARGSNAAQGPGNGTAEGGAVVKKPRKPRKNSKAALAAAAAAAAAIAATAEGAAPPPASNE